MLPRRYLPRLQRRKVIFGCVVCATTFLMYQVMFLVLLSADTNRRNQIHPRDLTRLKQIESLKIEQEKSTKAPKLLDSIPNVDRQNNKELTFKNHPKQGGLLKPKIDVKSKHLSFKINSTSLNKDDESVFTCVASGVIISKKKVNDDYCDCPDDGSDEPLTNACENSTFKCKKHSQNFPKTLPSTFVNDGVCDCCDGSDEWMKDSLPVTLAPGRQHQIGVHQSPCPDLCAER